MQYEGKQRKFMQESVHSAAKRALPYVLRPILVPKQKWSHPHTHTPTLTIYSPHSLISTHIHITTLTQSESLNIVTGCPKKERGWTPNDVQVQELLLLLQSPTFLFWPDQQLPFGLNNWPELNRSNSINESSFLTRSFNRSPAANKKTHCFTLARCFT